MEGEVALQQLEVMPNKHSVKDALTPRLGQFFRPFLLVPLQQRLLFGVSSDLWQKPEDNIHSFAVPLHDLSIALSQYDRIGASL